MSAPSKRKQPDELEEEEEEDDEELELQQQQAAKENVAAAPQLAAPRWTAGAAVRKPFKASERLVCSAAQQRSLFT